MNTVEKNILSKKEMTRVSAGTEQIFYEVSSSFDNNIHYSIVLEEGSEANVYIAVKTSVTLKVLRISFELMKKAKLFLHVIANFDGDDKAMIRFLINHRGDESFSEIRMRGIVRDSALLSLTGGVTIEKNAKGAITDIEERALSLSEHASISLVPDLSINEQTAKARHAAAIHEVQKNELLYMMSRGFTHHDAEEMLVSGFLNTEQSTWPRELKSHRLLS